MKTREVEINVGGRIIGFTAIGEGNYRFVVEDLVPNNECEVKCNVLDDTFVLIEASKLSLNDKFMQYEPRTKRESYRKEILTEIIGKGIEDFYRPKLDPSFDSEDRICYQARRRPATGKSYNWWKRNAKAFCPERKSRLGTKSEYNAFLGVLIKKLVESGWEVDAAWNAVCNDSKELGHYRNSEDALDDFELTGSREICGYFDLCNTSKFLAEDEDEEAGGFWKAGGVYGVDSFHYPLAILDHYRNCHVDCDDSVGWLVLS